MARPVIITCAVSGVPPGVKPSPHAPVTPAQIADECLAAARAGADIVHIHVRDPQTGAPSMKSALYREVVERVRASDGELLLNLTTGAGGMYLERGKPAPGNAPLVERAVAIIQAIGERPATPAEAREILGLRVTR